MTEKLLQFIWRFQNFNKSELETTSGDLVKVLFPGQYNTNQGPDFIDARLSINETIWAGSIELHLKTSDWRKHNHNNDKNYDNVMLHVVWEDDSEEGKKPDKNIPILELKGRVSKTLLNRFYKLMETTDGIPCGSLIHLADDITWKSWKDRLLAERLERKSKSVEILLKLSNNHWEETFWWLLAKNFGIKINADAFEAVAKSIPLNILAKHKNQVIQLEALLLGQAGLLNEVFTDDYPLMLQREYKFLREKYKLKPISFPIHFLRMRPGNFPTIRLAQLAMLVAGSSHLFSKIKEAGSCNEIKGWFDVTANDYWHYHYRFNETSVFRKKSIGDTMIDNILINTIAPVLFANGIYFNEQKYKDKAIQWLEQTAAEKNSITKTFQQLNVENNNAFDSQALIELKNEYCNKKRCLECTIATKLLRY